MNPTHTPPTVAVGDPTPADLLRAAATYLTRHGWTQGSYFTDPNQPTPAACMIGALVMATYGEPIEHPYNNERPECDSFLHACDILDDYLDRTITDAGTAIEFNDQPDTTADRVIAALTNAGDDYDRTHTRGERR